MTDSQPDKASAKNDLASKPKPALGGWVRADSDNVIRGWLTDRSDRSARLTVDVYIDYDMVARVTADRPDPKLVELGEGDGAYAFAVVIPDLYRDGQPHTFQAGTAEGFVLKSKVDEFILSPTDKAPVIQVTSLSGAEIVGEMTGGPYGKATQLEVWVGETRLVGAVETRWAKLSGSTTFTATLSGEARSRLGEDGWRLAIPGMIEAGLEGGAPPKIEIDFSARVNDAQQVVVQANAVVVDGEDVWGVRVSAWNDPDLVAAESPVVFHNGAAIMPGFTLPAAGVFRATLTRAGNLVSDGEALIRRRSGSMIANGGFQDWDTEGPRGWITPAATVDLSRSFVGFPKSVMEAESLSGDCVRFTMSEPPASETVLLRQLLDEPPGSWIWASMVIRASAPASASLQIVNTAGDVLARMPIEVSRSWIWALGRQPLTLGDREVDAAAIEVLVTSNEATVFDVAGVAFGGEGFDARAPEVAPVEPSPNLVVNARLKRWPSGVVIDNIRARTEVAEGWTVAKRKSDESIQAKAVMADAQTDDVALALTSTNDIACRLEVRLTQGARLLTRGFVSFEAGLPAVAMRMLRDGGISSGEFFQIHHLHMLRRTTRKTENGLEIKNDRVASVARRLLISRDYGAFRLPFVISEPLDTFDWATDYFDEEVEFYLVFEFTGAFAMAIRNLSVVSQENASEPEVGEFLQLEDRNIALQAERVSGLRSWIGKDAVLPSTPAALANAGPLARWRWSAQRQTVEIVVCVHDAIEDTLACLQSTIGSTSVPHTLRIIDDGSSATSAERLASFVSDKPWMTLVTNETNRGYTWSADFGVRGSEAEWVVLLNSDTIVSPGWLERLLDCALSDPAIAFVGPLSNAASFQSVPELYDARNQWKVNPLPVGWSVADVAEVVAGASRKVYPDVPLLNGFCTLMKRSVFIEAGGLDHTAFPMGYGEENDLCLRVRKAGYRLVVADDVYVYHVKSASFGSGRRAGLSKQGTAALKRLHPDVSLPDLTAGFRDTPCLVAMRAAIHDAYDQAL